MLHVSPSVHRSPSSHGRRLGLWTHRRSSVQLSSVQGLLSAHSLLVVHSEFPQPATGELEHTLLVPQTSFVQGSESSQSLSDVHSAGHGSIAVWIHRPFTWHRSLVQTLRSSQSSAFLHSAPQGSPPRHPWLSPISPDIPLPSTAVSQVAWSACDIPAPSAAVSDVVEREPVDDSEQPAAITIKSKNAGQGFSRACGLAPAASSWREIWNRDLLERVIRCKYRDILGCCRKLAYPSSYVTIMGLRVGWGKCDWLTW